MSLRCFIGTSDEITARLAGSPDPTATTVTVITDEFTFEVSNVSTFSAGDSIWLRQQKRIIGSIDGDEITLTEGMDPWVQVGDTIGHYDADYSRYRDLSQPFTYIDDLKTGGRTGDAVGNDLTIIDATSELPAPTVGNRITLFDDVDSSIVLFAGVVQRVTRTIAGKHSNGRLAYIYTLEALGYQDEADSLGIVEEPVFNVNAGEYLNYLRTKYTTLEVGEIDTTNSPTINFIRLNTVRRFSDVGSELSQLWPDSEFYIDNTHTVGKVYFRAKQVSYSPIVLNEALLEERGPIAPVKVSVDLSKTYNIVRLPFYRLQRRDPDLFVQSTVSDNAFLKPSVTLNGQPASIDESVLLFDDFLDGTLNPAFLEDDLSNPSPYTGFNSADGYLVEGEINDVTGLHLFNATGSSANLGDIGRATDPSETQPFTGQERQEIFLQEFVVNTAGNAIVAGIMNQATYLCTVQAGATTTSIPVDDASHLVAGDRITVGSEKAFIASISTNTLTLVSALPSPPSAGVTVTKHRLAKSRVKFGISFKANGDLKYIKNGVESAFATPRTYTGLTTYSIRIFMQCFETTISGGISSTGCSLNSATNFATGDVVDLFTGGSRNEPERRVITKSGSDITYAATVTNPKADYRVKTLPKLVVQIKGGTYGDINDRSWTTIHTEANTYQTSATVEPDKCGVLLCLAQSLVGTITLFRHRDPPGITASIGTRYLHVGTQEIESSDPDIDCIVRKVGNHYQLDFFPDTKTLWSSGSTLKIQYDEKFLFHLEDYNRESMLAVAKFRGYTVDDQTSIASLRRLGGKVLDTIELSPQPITMRDATSLCSAVLQAVKDVAAVVEITTNTYSHSIARAGQTVISELPGVGNVEIKRIELTEQAGAIKNTGSPVFEQRIICGSIDRISDVLQRRKIKANSRLVIDDGKNDDTYTDIYKSNIEERARTSDGFKTNQCLTPGPILYAGGVYSLIRCLTVEHGYDSASLSEAITPSDSFVSTECTTTTTTLYDGVSYTLIRCLRVA